MKSCLLTCNHELTTAAQYCIRLDLSKTRPGPRKGTWTHAGELLTTMDARGRVESQTSAVSLLGPPDSNGCFYTHGHADSPS